MDFKVKRIGQSKAKNPIVRFWKDHFSVQKTMLIVLLVTIGGLALAGTTWINNGGLKKTVSRVVSNLPLDQDELGHVNILLLGVAGVNEEGGSLSDSIMLASVDPAKPSVGIISLPRDLYMDSVVGEHKVNEIYARAKYENRDKPNPELIGLKATKQALSEFSGIEIHYGAVIDFEIFKEAVNALDGITIFVPESINDPFYPDDNYGFQTFVVRKGNQEMDGEMALKYARSRKTSSDYSRAQRQQDVLMAIRAKADSLNLLTDLSKIRNFYSIYKDNVVSDIDITEAVALAKIATAINYDNLVTAVLNDDPLQKGGFLYAPAREFYGGQFVLLPESWRDTQEFIRLTLMAPEVIMENTQIAIFNGSKISGLAGEMATRLRRFGFHVIETGNYDNDGKAVFTSFYQKLTEPAMTGTQQFLTNFLGVSKKELLPEESSVSDNPLVDIELVIGATQEQ